MLISNGRRTKPVDQFQPEIFSYIGVREIQIFFAGQYTRYITGSIFKDQQTVVGPSLSRSLVIVRVNSYSTHQRLAKNPATKLI